MEPKQFIRFKLFWIVLSLFCHMFLKMSACVSLRVVTNMVFLELKNYEGLEVLRLFSKAKREQCDQKNLTFSGKFSMLLSDQNSFFLELGARVSLQVATKWSIRGKKTLKIQIFRFFSEAKTVECDKKVQIYIFWKQEHAFC